MRDREIDRPWWILKVTFGVVPIVAGIDKFLHLLVDWDRYLSPLARDLLPISPSAFMQIVGVVEIAAGLLVLGKYTRLGAYVVSAWLVGIAINLVATGTYFDIAVRDLVMAASAFTLAKLSEARAHTEAREPARMHVSAREAFGTAG